MHRSIESLTPRRTISICSCARVCIYAHTLTHTHTFTEVSMHTELLEQYNGCKVGRLMCHELFCQDAHLQGSQILRVTGRSHVEKVSWDQEGWRSTPTSQANLGFACSSVHTQQSGLAGPAEPLLCGGLGVFLPETQRLKFSVLSSLPFLLLVHPGPWAELDISYPSRCSYSYRKLRNLV